MHRNNFKSALMAVAVASALAVTDLAQAAMLEEVVVTARKRSENLQQVPMAVSAYNAEELRAAQVDDILDLQRMTPNITLTTTGGLVAGAVSIFIRGIGNDAGFDQGVGIYVDDVYINRTTGALLDVYDVERVEVLKGPQGNLYGRNTIGGAIKFVSKEPTEELTGRVEVSAGDYDLMKVKGNISGPIIGDTLLGNFGALYKNRDGIQTNTFDNGDYWSEDIQAYRGALLWNATDTLKVKLWGDYSRDDSNPSIPNRVGVNSATLSGIDFVIAGANRFLGPGTGLVTTPNDASVPSDIDRVSTEFVQGFDQYKIEANTVAVTLDWEFHEQWNLKSITANRSLDNVQPFDFDGSNQQFITTLNDRKSDDFSQEFQLNFDADKIHSVMGLYYLDGSQKSPSTTYQYERLRAIQTQTKDTTKDTRDIESTSAYATVDWNMTEQWQLSLGGRYTEDKKKETQRATVTQGLYAYAGLVGFPQDAVVSVAPPGSERHASVRPTGRRSLCRRGSTQSMLS
ncbi:MAG: TonB-dependent receptor [Halioglobus sp.]